MKITIIALGAALIHVACSGSSDDGLLGKGSSSTEPLACTRGGVWRESYEKIEGDEQCDPIRSEDLRTTGNIDPRKRNCDTGCRCENSFNAASCDGKIKQTCLEDETTKHWDCTLSKVTDTKVSGTCKLDIEAPKIGASLHCTYAINYDWIAP